MKHPLWLLLFMLLLTGPYGPSLTFAQAPTPTDSIRLQVSPAVDTLGAIHQLFLSKRRSAKEATWIGVGMTATGFLVGELSYALVNSVKRTTSGKPLEEGATSVSLKFSIPGLVITTIGLVKRSYFSRRREAAVTSAYEQGKGLPLGIQRLLKKQQLVNP